MLFPQSICQNLTFNKACKANEQRPLNFQKTNLALFNSHADTVGKVIWIYGDETMKKNNKNNHWYMGLTKRTWYLSPMRAVKVQASLRIHPVSPEPPLLAHTSSESRGTFRQKARSLAPLNGWACAVKIWHDGMLEDTNSLDAPHMIIDIGVVTKIPTFQSVMFP